MQKIHIFEAFEHLLRVERAGSPSPLISLIMQPVEVKCYFFSAKKLSNYDNYRSLQVYNDFSHFSETD